MLELPAFAATHHGEGPSWGRSCDSPAARLRSRTPSRPSWITTTSLGPPGGSTGPRWPAWSPSSARQPLSASYPARCWTAGSARHAAVAPATWNRELATLRAAVGWWRRRGWLAVDPTGDLGRRREQIDRTRALTRGQLERLFAHRDLPLRERTLWRLLYETAARANELLALDVEDLDLANRRARVHSKGGAVEWVFWQTGSAQLLPTPAGRPDQRTGVSRRPSPDPRSRRSRPGSRKRAGTVVVPAGRRALPGLYRVDAASVAPLSPHRVDGA